MSFGPFVSVVVPTYNRNNQTIAAIESVLAQTYPNFEIIVVNDGSTDGSGEAIQRFIGQCKNRGGPIQQIHYLNQANQGPSAARNTGIENARGEYIAFIDSDDVWAPDKLEWQLRALEQFRGVSKACFTDARQVDDLGTDVSSFQTFGHHYEEVVGIEPDAERLLAGAFCGFWVSTLLARTEVIRQIGGFDAEIPFAEDHDFFFRLSRVTPLVYVNKQLVRSDRSATPRGSTCRPWDRMEVQLRGRERMYRKWLAQGTELRPEVRRTVLHSLRSVHSGWANWHLENERYGEARRAVSRALQYEAEPRMLLKWALVWVAPGVSRRLFAKSQSHA